MIEIVSCEAKNKFCKELPYVMQTKMGGLLVLFTEISNNNGKGIVLKENSIGDNKYSKLGSYRTDWCMDAFKYYNDSLLVTLKVN